MTTSAPNGHRIAQRSLGLSAENSLHDLNRPKGQNRVGHRPTGHAQVRVDEWSFDAFADVVNVARKAIVGFRIVHVDVSGPGPATQNHAKDVEPHPIRMRSIGCGSGRKLG